MARKSTTKHLTRHLVLGYLERIARGVFSDFPKELTDLVGKEHGVYSLYKGDHLYYVGLASNLRTRIKNHLKDRHAKKWDKFSLYLVRKQDHIKELEALVLRIADPKGNATTGKLKRAVNLKGKLKSTIRKAQQATLGDLLDETKKASPHLLRKGGKKRKVGESRPNLSSYIDRGFPIRAQYRGKLYKARVRKDGTVFFRGVVYNSPSGATRPITPRPFDGWLFWKFKNDIGDWVALATLRKV